ncbi:MAG: hypothetical protein U5K43_03025 [Halofilum sp. (in: g-proteobacteria)]|nr:hypothetical protein [Halofilum sp. (in: g-proteobacteria)]
MVRLFACVLAWPLGLILLLSLYGWYRAEFPAPPEDPAAPGAIRFPAFQRQARDAITRFGRLSPAEQHAVADGLRAAVRPLDDWLGRLERADYSVVCLGEFHEPDTRRFVAETFLPRYAPDVLLLEATPDGLAWIEDRTAAGREYVPLLGADVAGVLRAARAANPAVAVRGIEETRAQVRTRRRHEGSRDRSLARNFWLAFRPGARHLILYGALHCSDDPGWLYRLLRVQSPPREALRMLSVQVLAACRTWAHLLRRVGIGPYFRSPSSNSSHYSPRTIENLSSIPARLVTTPQVRQAARRPPARAARGLRQLPRPPRHRPRRFRDPRYPAPARARARLVRAPRAAGAGPHGCPGRLPRG